MAHDQPVSIGFAFVQRAIPGVVFDLFDDFFLENFVDRQGFASMCRRFIGAFRRQIHLFEGAKEDFQRLQEQLDELQT